MNIKVSFSGQYLDQPGHIASFQDGESVWIRKLFNPRECGRDIFKNKDIEKCYAVWYDSDNGCNYSLIMKSPDTTTRDGYIMIVMCTGDKIFTNGSDVLSLFEKLRHLFVDTEYTSVKNLTEECSDKVKELTQSVSLSYDRTYNGSNEVQGKAFRLYNGEEELAMILQHPNQREYVHFERIFVLPNSDYSELCSNGYSEITSPIKKVYNVKKPLPDGVSVDAERLYEDDTLCITYTKSGCKSQPTNVRLNGILDPHIVYLNNEVEIKSAQDAGVEFKKEILIECFSEENIRVNDISIRFNGKTVHDQNNRFTFEDNCESCEFDIVSRGYKEEHVILEPSDFERGVKTVTLKSKTVQIDLKLDAGKKKIKGKISIKTTDPLYPYLNDAYHRCIAINKYKFEDSGTGGGQPHGGENGGNDAHGRCRFPKWLERVGYTLSGLCIIYLIYALYCITDGNTYPWPFGHKKTTTITATSYSCSHEGCVCTDCIAEAGSECTCTCEACKPKTEDLTADLEYLKTQDEWSKNELTSDKYKELMDYIKNGQIDDIIKKPWFEVSDPVNGFWSANNEGIYELLIKISADSEKKNKAVDCLKNAFSNGKLPLSSLKKSLQVIANPADSKALPTFESLKKEEKDIKKPNVDEGKRPGSHG